MGKLPTLTAVPSAFEAIFFKDKLSHTGEVSKFPDTHDLVSVVTNV